MISPAYTDEELDEILRGDGYNDWIGVSAIDGLIAALVAGPCFVHPNEWMALIFGRAPNICEGSLELPIVNTLVNSYNETSAVLSERPAEYRPKFMNHEGRVIVRHWVVGFMLGVGLRAEAWSIVLLTEHRKRMAPILVAYDDGPDLLPDVPAGEKARLRKVAHHHIAGAVTAVRDVCMPHRVAEARASQSRRRKR